MRVAIGLLSPYMTSVNRRSWTSLNSGLNGVASYDGIEIEKLLAKFLLVLVLVGREFSFSRHEFWVLEC